MKEDDPYTEPLVSVIIPVFNTQQYLDEALLSIRSQSLKDLQIICVDDASTDGSLEVLRRHASKDSRVVVVAQGVNSGVGATRNLALQQAEGRYVYFFDSDDMLDARALECLVAVADRETLDSVFFNARPLIDNSMDPELLDNYQRQYKRSHHYSSMSGAELVVAMNRLGEWKPSPCLYLTRREFLDQAKLRFSEGVLHEDNGFTMRLMLSAQRVGYDASEYYIRRVRAESITTASISDRHVRGLVVAAAELILALHDTDLDTQQVQGLPNSVATQAELIFHDAVMKFLRLGPAERQLFSEWQPARPEHLFLRHRLNDRAGLETLEVTLRSREEELHALNAEMEAIRRSRALRLAKWLRSFRFRKSTSNES